MKTTAHASCTPTKAAFRQEKRDERLFCPQRDAVDDFGASVVRDGVLAVPRP